MSEYTVTDFRVGTVLEQGFRIFGRNLVAFAILALLVYGVLLLLGVALGAMFASPSDPYTDEAGPGVSSFAIMVLSFAMMFFLTATLTYGTYQEMRGRRVGVPACVASGLQLILPVCGVAILTILATAMGILLLVIPGLIVATMLWVAIPVAVVERPGVVECLRRSSALTSGYRWPIFGIMVLTGLLEMAANQVLGVAAGAGTWTAVIGEQIVTVVLLVLKAVMPAVGYFHLRSVKEGVGLEELAAVFD